MNVADYKCPNCRADMTFNPETQKLDCHYCGSHFTLEDLSKNELKYEKVEVKPLTKKKYKELDENMDLYTCPNCGASIITEPNVITTSCVYCRSNSILKDKLSGVYEPSRIIPFKKTKEDAIAAFTNVGKGKFLMPKEFKDSKNINEMTGIYIPFWLYDCVVNGNIQMNASIVTSWTSGSYYYTKKDSYHVRRGGKIEFDKIPVDGSLRFKDEYMNSIEPFDYKDLQAFSPSYLLGFVSEKYDVDKDAGLKIATDRATESMVSSLVSTVKGYTNKTIISKEVVASETANEYVLLPVWMLNIKYKDQIYTFAMNGQTGKLIGNIPYSKSKLFFFFLAIFMISAIVLGLITYFAG